MVNRAILSRIKAKKLLAQQEVILAKKTDDDPIKIAMKDPSTGAVVKEFNSIDEAIAEGFNKANLAGALKNGNKYKGHLWTTIE